ncbi:MAG: tRNA (guanosine(37)-N1)-methyltransferase TrmD [Lentisphaeraceae bacterium]|nr:tRNA (guanosine(37)-N1)-methyltransferase TrmD [Lentisphaeraceae bacterium]
MPLKLDIITIFPEIFFGPFDASIVKRARDKGLVEINVINLREFTSDKHRSVDDRPYGGGPGMVMTPEPIFKAVESVRTPDSKVLLMAPQGEVFKQKIAAELKDEQHLIFICGHFEGIDDRVRQGLVDREISIGDYILSNGNLAAMVISDAIIRLLPGALGCEQSAVLESFSEGLLEHPQYTRPLVFRDMEVPEVLLSGNHKKIEHWRHEQSLKLTKQKRPDLVEESQK